MVKTVEMTPRRKSVCVALHNEGYSTRDIAHRIGFNKSSVSRLLKKWKDTGSTERKEGRGRKKLSTPSQDRFLMRLSLRNRLATSTDLKPIWESVLEQQVSARTIRRRLCGMGMTSHRPTKKPLLTKKMKSARLKWAKEHRSWTEDDWRKVVFSDESKFNLHGSDGVHFVRRRISEKYHPDCILGTVKHPPGQMVWGCISCAGVGQLHFINGTVNAPEYIKILGGPLKHSIRDKFGDDTHKIFFQHDGAPCHRAKVVQKYFRDNKITVLTWPGNSPDLNPIENCWSELKRKVADRKPQSKRQLQEVLINIWYHHLDITYIKNLINSMPNRCAAVIKAKGGSTKY
jgi:transposase